MLTANVLFLVLSIAKAETTRPVILDVIIPFEDGSTVARELKVELAKIPIIILTNFSQRVGETYISASQDSELETEEYIKRLKGL